MKYSAVYPYQDTIRFGATKLLLLFFFCCISGIQARAAAEIWLAPDGSDQQVGSVHQPMGSLQGALRKARELRRLDDASIQNGIEIILKDGCYVLPETLLVRPEDSGTEQSPTTIRAQHYGQALISGGMYIEGWQPLNKKVKGMNPGIASKVWVAKVPKYGGRHVDFRQFYINGQKARVASSSDTADMQRILAVDYEQREIHIPAPKQKSFVTTDGMEFFIHQMWEVAILRIKDLRISGKKALLSFHAPESRLEFEHPWPPPVISEQGNSPFILSRAIEFLDEPGEWYHDTKQALLYYIPLEGQNMAEAECVIPVLETLVSVQGSLDRPVQHLRFEGLRFAYTTWLRPSLQGYVPLQAGMYLLDAYKLQVPGTADKAALENQAWVGRQAAAVELYAVNNTLFEACRFEHLGATGLDYLEAACDDRIEGCVFWDIAGSGIVMGRFSEPGTETHLPYQALDSRELSRRAIIRDNYIYDCATEYWGCPGLLAGYVQDLLIEHNEICELPYTGISVGWGWTKTDNCMKNNHIIANRVHSFGRHNYSCGGLYTLSAQTGTVIAENYVYNLYQPDYVHDKTQGYYIYLDEASSWMSIRDNWCSQPKFGQNQPGLNHWENNGPQVDERIKQKAGIRSHWQHIKEAL